MIALQIKKGGEEKVLNIINNLDINNLLKVIFSYNEADDSEMVKIFATLRNKSKIFNIVKDSARKRCRINKLKNQLQELYKMHKLLKNEDISHQILYNSGKFFDSVIVKNIDSYYEYGLNRVKSIYSSFLWQTTDNMNNQNYNYLFKNKSKMLNTMKQVNGELNKEFEFQNNELEELSKKYRKDLKDESADMYTRLAKVRDEYEI